MATFSTNQARQLYVATELSEAAIKSSDTSGKLFVGGDTAKTHLYFQVMGAGGPLRSDIIELDNIISAKAVDADSMVYHLKKVEVTLDSNVNSGNPIAGQDYILNINFRNFGGLSDEHQYCKYGAVHAISQMTASNFYKALVISLVKNFSREVSPLLKFSLKTSSSPIEVTADTKESSLNGTYTGVILEEIPQEWILGKMEQVPLNFDVIPDTVISNGDELVWGIASVVANSTKIENGHKIADLEYFCAGEKGDQYRGAGYPNNIDTKYLVDPNARYNTIDIHYSYIGANESVQKSEKDITLVIPKAAGANSVGNALINKIIDKIKTVSGLDIAKLSVA